MNNSSYRERFKLRVSPGQSSEIIPRLESALFHYHVHGDLKWIGDTPEGMHIEVTLAGDCRDISDNKLADACTQAMKSVFGPQYPIIVRHRGERAQGS